MPSLELLYLSQQQVVDVAPFIAESVEIISDTLREHGKKEVENPPKLAVHPLPRTFMHLMSGLLRRKKQEGMKWVSGFSSTHERGLPNIPGLIVLKDPETGIIDLCLTSEIPVRAQAKGIGTRLEQLDGKLPYV